MCRWFVYLGEESILLEDVLIKPKHSIVKQIDIHFLPNLHIIFDAHHGIKRLEEGTASDEQGPNHLTNVDGFGIGYYTGATAEFNDDNISRPCVYRNTRPPLNDLNLLSLCAHTATQCVFAHIRAGTGMSPTVETNNHPFIFGRYLFMHNGSITNFHQIKISLLQKLSRKAYENVFGTTDTEHLAALFFTHLGDDWDRERSIDELKQAMKTTIDDVLALVANTHHNENEIVKPSALNLAVTDGYQLVAVRFLADEKLEPPSLYYSTTAGPILNRKYSDESKMHGKHIIVASEPNTYDVNDWHVVPANSFVLVDKHLHLTLEKIRD